MFRVIGDDTRFRIVRSLLAGDKCVGDLVRRLKTSQPHVSHHLRVLRQAGLVEGVRAGQRVRYRLLPDAQEHLTATSSKKGALDFGCCRISFSRTAPSKH
jgi:DNA-binding transcriptional ArsR family regulator